MALDLKNQQKKQRLGRPAKRQGRDTRHEILKAALNLFATKGFHAASMRQIAHAVGVRESALYAHFKGKHDILESLFAVYGPAQFPLVTKQFEFKDSLSGLAEEIKKVVHSVLEIWARQEEQMFLKIVLMELILSKEKPFTELQLVKRVRQVLEHGIEELSKRGLIRPVSSELVVRLFASSLMLLRVEHLLSPVNEEKLNNVKSRADAIIDFLVQALKP